MGKGMDEAPALDNAVTETGNRVGKAAPQVALHTQSNGCSEHRVFLGFSITFSKTSVGIK